MNTQNLPFNEKILSENTFIREFKHETDSGEYEWHRDREDRIIEPIGQTDWLIQLDDELPKLLKGEIFIPIGVYHRLIKGTGDLTIKLIKNPGDARLKELHTCGWCGEEYCSIMH
jgi:hypothetical protein